MTIPINMLWRVQISVRKQLALTGIFSLVLVTMVIAIVRVAVNSAFGLRTDTPGFTCGVLLSNVLVSLHFFEFGLLLTYSTGI